MLENWHRIEKVVKWSGMSVNAFAKHIGLGRAENLYQIKKGKNRISANLAQTIVDHYPQISKGWLLSGEGAMLVRDAIRQSTDIPFFEMEAVKYASSREYITTTFYISCPMFDKGTFAALCMGDAMVPEIPTASVGVFAKVEIDQIVPGKTYLIVSESFTGIRTIRTGGSSGKLRLVPANKENYDQITIDPETITKLYQVIGVLIDKQI